MESRLQRANKLVGDDTESPESRTRSQNQPTNDIRSPRDLGDSPQDSTLFNATPDREAFDEDWWQQEAHNRKMSCELRESEEEQLAARCDDRMLAWTRSPYNYGGVPATMKNMEVGTIEELRAEIRELRMDTEKELIRSGTGTISPHLSVPSGAAPRG